MTSEPKDAPLVDLLTAVADRDAAALHRLIIETQFVLISVNDDDDDDESMGALTAEIDDSDVVVAFTSETMAGDFVKGMADLFAEEDEVQGFIVNGDSLLDYLPDKYGLLLNPETSNASLIDAELICEILSSTNGPK